MKNRVSRIIQLTFIFFGIGQLLSQFEDVKIWGDLVVALIVGMVLFFGFERSRDQKKEKLQEHNV